MFIIVHEAEAVKIGTKMKNVLQEAIRNFESNCDDTTAPKVDMTPAIVRIIGQRLASKDICLTWDMYITYPYMLWDPLIHYKTFFSKNKLNCPLCSADGAFSNILRRSGKWFDGNSARLNPRVIFDLHTCTLLVSALYTCCRSHEIAACHPVILQMLNENVDLPFFLTHKRGFTFDLANLVEQLVDSGMSFEQVNDVIKNQYKTTYDRFEASFWRDLELSKSYGVNYEQIDSSFPSFCHELFPNPSIDLLIDIFLKRFLENEDLYKNSMNSLKAQCITCDHTFKSVCNIGYVRHEDKTWVNQYNSIFCVLNENGEVLNWQFTKSEGFEEVKDMFQDIRLKFQSNPLKIICIDNCCKWKLLLNDIFPETMIKQDLFHAVQRFTKTLKKRTRFIVNLRMTTEKFSEILKTTETNDRWTRPIKIPFLPTLRTF